MKRLRYKRTISLNVKVNEGVRVPSNEVWKVRVYPSFCIFANTTGVKHPNSIGLIEGESWMRPPGVEEKQISEIYAPNTYFANIKRAGYSDDNAPIIGIAFEEV